MLCHSTCGVECRCRDGVECRSGTSTVVCRDSQLIVRARLQPANGESPGHRYLVTNCGMKVAVTKWLMKVDVAKW